MRVKEGVEVHVLINVVGVDEDLALQEHEEVVESPLQDVLLVTLLLLILSLASLRQLCRHALLQYALHLILLHGCQDEWRDHVLFIHDGHGVFEYLTAVQGTAMQPFPDEQEAETLGVRETLCHT